MKYLGQILLVNIFLWASINSASAEIKLDIVPVTGNIYALVGETGPRTKENHGLNNTLGFIVTDKGVILISSGTTQAATEKIKQSISAITPKPITHVINIGTQDHHWMGNHYFAKTSSETVALKVTADNQKTNTDAQLSRLEAGIGSKIETVRPEHATTIIEANRHEMTIDDINLVLIWPGEGHYAGDALLWIPASNTLFSGDFIYMERMLGIHPTSNVVTWNKSFQFIENLKPLHIIPGHGKPTTLSGAKKDTGNYLAWLINNVTAAQEDWKEIDETIDSLADAPQFKHLIHYKDWHRRNIHQTYLQLESR